MIFLNPKASQTGFDKRAREIPRVRRLGGDEIESLKFSEFRAALSQQIPHPENIAHSRGVDSKDQCLGEQ